MKKKILMVVLPIILFVSCDYSNTSNTVVYEKKYTSYKILPVVSMYLNDHQETMNNDITKNKAAKELQKAVFDSIRKDSMFLYELPLEYKTALKKGNRYIVLFSLSSVGEKKCENGQLSVSFDLYSVVSEDVVTSLKEGEYYNVSGKFVGSVNNRIILPSGNTIYNNPNINDDLGRVHVSLGGLYIEKMRATPSWKFGIN